MAYIINVGGWKLNNLNLTLICVNLTSNHVNLTLNHANLVRVPTRARDLTVYCGGLFQHVPLLLTCQCYHI